MKKSVVLLFVLCSTQLLHSQENETKVETIKQTVEGKKGADRAVIDLHFDNWFHQIKDFETEWFSRGVNFYLMYDVPFGTSPISFSIGGGVANSNIYHNSLIAYDTANVISFVKWDSTYKKNKISTSFLEVPVELRFRSKPSSPTKSVKVGLGFKGGYLIDSHTKVKFKEGKRKVFKEKGIANLNKWRYGPTFRLGYGPVSVYGFYNMATFFNSNDGPTANPFSIGLSINAL